MKTKEIEIKNPNLCRKWGWGRSYTPTGYGIEIEHPKYPEYAGTLRQIEKAIEKDGWFFRSMNNAFCCDGWFYDGEPIHSVYEYVMLKAGEDTPENPNGFYDDATYGWTWVKSFDLFDYMDGYSESVKIRIELEEEN